MVGKRNQINICSTLARQALLPSPFGEGLGVRLYSLAKELQSSKTSELVFQLGSLHNED